MAEQLKAEPMSLQTPPLHVRPAEASQTPAQVLVQAAPIARTGRELVARQTDAQQTPVVQVPVVPSVPEQAVRMQLSPFANGVAVTEAEAGLGVTLDE